MQHTRTKIFLFLSCVIIAATGFIPKSIPSKPVTVYIFLSGSCPICQNYTVTLNALYKKYHPQNINFIGVFPDDDVEADSIVAFKKKYFIPFGLVPDKKAALTKHFNATITPEV